MTLDGLSLLDCPDQCAPWGDYGDILSQGLAIRHDDGRVELSRSGPFVPPISFPGSGNLLVTGETKNLLQNSGLVGIGEFLPVIKVKVVMIPWHEWNPHENLPNERLPFNGEPEEYIHHNPHCHATANAIGNIWSWEPERMGRVNRDQEKLSFEGIRESDFDVFRVNDRSFRRIFVKDRVKKMIEQSAGNWVAFETVEY